MQVMAAWHSLGMCWQPVPCCACMQPCSAAQPPLHHQCLLPPPASLLYWLLARLLAMRSTAAPPAPLTGQPGGPGGPAGCTPACGACGSAQLGRAWAPQCNLPRCMRPGSHQEGHEEGARLCATPQCWRPAAHGNDRLASTEGLTCWQHALAPAQPPAPLP